MIDNSYQSPFLFPLQEHDSCYVQIRSNSTFRRRNHQRRTHFPDGEEPSLLAPKPSWQRETETIAEFNSQRAHPIWDPPRLLCLLCAVIST
ncbi:hypothetical protein AVEN_212328-1 [Araneus ventricosus]|uniref:Uncharacterized protein n=1 Tax=Araneus ventricosus TaxID=182803 RepID=A0A4Y2F282_ARAVE|nr:hypothetical protein AVEN_212328-1 [Araneus ventricosus]